MVIIKCCTQHIAYVLVLLNLSGVLTHTVVFLLLWIGEELSSVDTLQGNRIRMLTATANDRLAKEGRYNIAVAFSNGTVQVWEATLSTSSTASAADSDDDNSNTTDSSDGSPGVVLECIDELSTGGERLVGISACVIDSRTDDSDRDSETGADGQRDAIASQSNKAKPPKQRNNKRSLLFAQYTDNDDQTTSTADSNGDDVTEKSKKRAKKSKKKKKKKKKKAQ